jgi:hypothetical protein
MDHFPPKAYSVGGFLLPSCKECNLLAGTIWPRNFELRSEHVKDGLRKRYRKLLQAPDWDEDELNGLKYNLRKGIIVWQKQKEMLKERLAWSAMSYLSSIDHSSSFVPTFAEDVPSEDPKRKSSIVRDR